MMELLKRWNQIDAILLHISKQLKCSVSEISKKIEEIYIENERLQIEISILEKKLEHLIP